MYARIADAERETPAKQWTSTPPAGRVLLWCGAALRGALGLRCPLKVGGAAGGTCDAPYMNETGRLLEELGEILVGRVPRCDHLVREKLWEEAFVLSTGERVVVKHGPNLLESIRMVRFRGTKLLASYGAIECRNNFQGIPCSGYV